MEILDFIPQNTYIVCVVLFIVGMILKQTPFIKNWVIPYILSIVGILICNFVLEPGVYATMQGILTTGFTVYIHQLSKQGSQIFTSKEKDSTKSSFNSKFKTTVSK
ncbi:MAG: phage holin family protein [Oscillospiraceae bacterium]|jgi:nicotinamide riboside transporter PnuC|nr:phage holin family protein [Oscillospiraceae bacterium]